MAKLGYGEYIRTARESIPLTREELATRINRTYATVQRIEEEDTEPSMEQVNALVAALPISAEELLRRMGAHLNPPTAMRLPRNLTTALADLAPDDYLVLERIARGLRQVPASQSRPVGSK